MSEWFNDDQVGHMKSLGAIPQEHRCGSGWHVRPEFADRYPGQQSDCRCDAMIEHEANVRKRLVELGGGG